MFRIIVCAIAAWFKSQGIESSHDAFSQFNNYPNESAFCQLYSILVVALAANELSATSDLHGYLVWHLRDDLFRYLPDVNLNEYMNSDIPKGWLTKW